MKREKSEKKTYAKPRVEEMERILKELDEVGLTLKKTEDGNYILKEKEEK